MTTQAPDSQAVIMTLIGKGNEIITHAKECFIFRSSVAYIAQQVHSLLLAGKALGGGKMTEGQLSGFRKMHELFSHFDSVLPHLCEGKWVQPALNWPATYVHKYIDDFRDNLIRVAPSVGFATKEIIRYEKGQDHVNKQADLKALEANLKRLLEETQNEGLQGQIETRLAEIAELLSAGSKRMVQRRPSAAQLPIVRMKKKVEELLMQFKSIDIAVDDLLIQGQIGVGGFGAVSKATRLSTSEIVAVKELRSDRLTMSSWASLYAEVETMVAVSHPFVLELVGAHITEPYRIITRLCPGKSLFDRLHKRNANLPYLTSTRLTRIAYQVAVGMAHLHSESIVHRDLKTLNILLDEEDDGCVADFGLSGMMKGDEEMVGGVGTPHYTAPEVLAHMPYGPKVDTFSYGVVLWEMLMRKIPYGEVSHMAIYEHVVTRSWRQPIPNETPDGLKKIITRCWSKNPNDRPEFNEIVGLFEKGAIFFPDSEHLDFQVIKATRRCPPLDMAYALSVLRNPDDSHFSSIIYFICSKIDDKLRARLRAENVMTCLVRADVNIDAVLMLASVVLDEGEFEDFLRKGGLEMFRLCVETFRGQSISAALQFGIKVPRAELGQLKVFLPKIVAFLDRGTCQSHSHALQFLTRFTSEELSEFKDGLHAALLDAIKDVNDQESFDAIVALMPLCHDGFEQCHKKMFYQLLSRDFVVPPTFVTALIKASGLKPDPLLVLAILKATAKSDVTGVFLEFLRDCAENHREIFAEVYEIPEFLPTMQGLIETEAVRAPLFLLFCVSPLTDAAKTLANHPILQSLIRMKGYNVQCLQILTILCESPKFCVDTQHINGIIQRITSSMVITALIPPAVRLIGALSMHEVGCTILKDHGVLELFTQMFLSSVSTDSSILYTILRNVARYNCDIPQGSLIISCLMQEMVDNQSMCSEILSTLLVLVSMMPESVQEHDLREIVIEQLHGDNPVIIRIALGLFTMCNPHTLRNIYPQIIDAVYSILNDPALLYPEILVLAFQLISLIARNYDISDFVQKTDLLRFIDDIAALSGSDVDDSEFVKMKQSIGSLRTPL